MATTILVKETEPHKLTTSSSQVMTLKGTHNFKIHDYFYHKGLGIGKYIASDTFSVGGHQWEIRFFPDGDRKHENGDIYVSLFVYLVSKCEKNLKFWFEYYLLDQNGNRWRVVKPTPFVKMEVNQRCMIGPIIINAKSTAKGWGYPDFYKRSEFEESQFIKDDCFTIQCSVHVAKTETEAAMLAQPIIPFSDLKQSYELLLESREGSDISFEVEGEIFYAHKLILSTRSPVFKAQFFGPLKNDNTQCIKIEEMQAPVFKALLHFIYSDVIPNPSSDCDGTILTQHILAAADRYGILTLKSLCESRLCKNHAIETVASTLALAIQHGCFLLKSSCFEFIGLPNNLEEVMQTDGFKMLHERSPETICELLKSVARGSDSSSDVKETSAKSRKPVFGCAGFRFWRIGKLKKC